MEATSEALRSLYSQLDPPAHFLDQLCKHAVELVDDAHMAGITVVESDSVHHTIAATDRLVHTVDAIQFKLRTGPALVSANSTAVVHAHSDEASIRWPQFFSAARTFGISSFLSVPLPGHNGSLGTLNLYSRDNRGFTGTDVALVQLFAIASAYALHNSQRLALVGKRVADLELALESRGIIDQAKGIIMGTRHVDADHAFSILIQESQKSNIKLRVIAQQHIAAAVGVGHAGSEIRDSRPAGN
ncbi:GAF and ANTAR domain-containing protein [Rhodococcus sp. IEGM 1379]|uniref:GAF and ANTAR domain-containing protein n=1 Tax=Rhodococcus sp. IEGM 1379 TaxID=3047086 RepID=UPI0024B7939B|nr:GAF and ANTAR domain-containing protein [Rhodococcus sp. IEGM 1379]MDI9916023.1 GAF and ANTAR domain-containing protein [Rhodococcus sp. IEGM 1379]